MVTVVYEITSVKVSTREFEPIGHVIRLAVEAMGLEFDKDVVYVAMNPEEDAILAMDCQVTSDFILLKKLKMSDSPYMFSPSTFSGEDRMSMMRLPTLSCCALTTSRLASMTLRKNYVTS